MTTYIEKLLNSGIKAYQNGRKDEARQIFEHILEDDKTNERAWLWLSGLVDNVDEQRICLENVLIINPSNDRAKYGLKELERMHPAMHAVTSTRLPGAKKPDPAPSAQQPTDSSPSQQPTDSSPSQTPAAPTADNTMQSPASSAFDTPDFSTPTAAEMAQSSAGMFEDDFATARLGATEFDTGTLNKTMNSAGFPSSSLASPETQPAQQADRPAQGRRDKDAPSPFTTDSFDKLPASRDEVARNRPYQNSAFDSSDDFPTAGSSAFGDAFSGDTFSGDGFSGDTFSGDSYSSNTFSDDGFADGSFTDDSLFGGQQSAFVSGDDGYSGSSYSGGDSFSGSSSFEQPSGYDSGFGDTGVSNSGFGNPAAGGFGDAAGSSGSGGYGDSGYSSAGYSSGSRGDRDSFGSSDSFGRNESSGSGQQPAGQTSAGQQGGQTFGQQDTFSTFSSNSLPDDFDDGFNSPDASFSGEPLNRAESLYASNELSDYEVTSDATDFGASAFDDGSRASPFGDGFSSTDASRFENYAETAQKNKLNKVNPQRALAEFETLIDGEETFDIDGDSSLQFDDDELANFRLIPASIAATTLPGTDHKAPFASVALVGLLAIANAGLLAMLIVRLAS